MSVRTPYSALPYESIEKAITNSLGLGLDIIDRAELPETLRPVAYGRVLDFLLPISMVAAADEYDGPGGHLRPITEPPEPAA